MHNRVNSFSQIYPTHFKKEVRAFVFAMNPVASSFVGHEQTTLLSKFVGQGCNGVNAVISLICTPMRGVGLITKS